MAGPPRATAADVLAAPSERDGGARAWLRRAARVLDEVRHAHAIVHRAEPGEEPETGTLRGGAVSRSECTHVEGGRSVFFLHGAAPPVLVPVRAISVRRPARAPLCGGSPRVHQREYARIHPATHDVLRNDRLAGISLPAVPAWPRALYGGARLIIVRSVPYCRRQQSPGRRTNGPGFGTPGARGGAPPPELRSSLRPALARLGWTATPAAGPRRGGRRGPRVRRTAAGRDPKRQGDRDPQRRAPLRRAAAPEAEETLPMFARRDSHAIGASAFKQGRKPEWPNHGL